MARVAKSDVYRVFDRAHDVLLAAANRRGIINKARVRKAAANLGKASQQLVDNYLTIVSKRSGPMISVHEAESTLRWVKSKMVDKYDANRNGLSADEIQMMSPTAKLAVGIVTGCPVNDSIVFVGKCADNVQKTARSLAEQTSQLVYDYNDTWADKPVPREDIEKALRSATWHEVTLADPSMSRGHRVIAAEGLSPKIQGRVYLFLDDNNVPRHAAFDSDDFGLETRPIRREKILLEGMKRDSIPALKRAISAYGQKPFFDGLGSEGAADIEPIFIPFGKDQPLTKDNFARAVDFPVTDNPDAAVDWLMDGEQTLRTFVDDNRYAKLYYGQETEAAHADKLRLLMKANLKDIRAIVMGPKPDNWSERDVYLVGRAKDGSLMGFKSIVAWT